MNSILQQFKVQSYVRAVPPLAPAALFYSAGTRNAKQFMPTEKPDKSQIVHLPVISMFDLAAKTDYHQTRF
jgi:hypothetical protein